jgi:hypothetical protein
MLVPTAQSKDQGAPAQAAEVPFLVGSQRYHEAPFFTYSVLLDGNQHTVTPVPEITPGNFLSGVTLAITASGGVLGSASTITDDGALAVISSLELADTGGGSILYPMNLFAAAMGQKYLRPWSGDPIKRPGFSNSINPTVTLDYSVEIRDTLACLVNTDARAQYRLNIVVAPGANLAGAIGTTYPTITINGWLNAWAQPDAVDLAGRPITPFPPGLAVQRKLMHETINLNAGNNTVRLTLTGNEVRGLIAIFRDTNGNRVDLTDANAGVMQFRLDNRVIWRMKPSQIIEQMHVFYSRYFGGGTSGTGYSGTGGAFTGSTTAAGFNRETGVYVLPRFRDPGSLGGEYWLQTVEQSLLQIEFNGGDGATTVEIIYDQLAVAGDLDPMFEGV